MQMIKRLLDFIVAEFAECGLFLVQQSLLFILSLSKLGLFYYRFRELPQILGGDL